MNDVATDTSSSSVAVIVTNVVTGALFPTAKVPEISPVVALIATPAGRPLAI